MGIETGHDRTAWPPDDRHPIEEWTDHELIDQYRYIKAELAAEEREYLESDDSALAALISEITRRGLDDLAGLLRATSPAPAEKPKDQPHFRRNQRRGG